LGNKATNSATSRGSRRAASLPNNTCAAAATLASRRETGPG
jgi:hypothetical protein